MNMSYHSYLSEKFTQPYTHTRTILINDNISFINAENSNKEL